MKEKKNWILTVIIISLLATTSNSKTCVGVDGRNVAWWVQLIFPGTFQNGFGYMDSLSSSSYLQVHREKADSVNTALTRTLTQINEQNLQSIAWNDQWPTGQSSSSKAHSKGIIAFDDKYEIGYYLGHSIPQYPSFIQSAVNTTINGSQSIYAQHTVCITLDSLQIKDQLNRILPIKPYIYARNIKNQTLYQEMVGAAQVEQPDYKSNFTLKNYYINGVSMKFIYKNGAINASIFEDGLNRMLDSAIVAQTWGRPLQQPWCDQVYPIYNVRKVSFGNQIEWLQTKDHSKWAYAIDNNYVCFGDMNRMTSQWKRGGAFYCINSVHLKRAFVAISQQVTVCEPKKYKINKGVWSFFIIIVASFFTFILNSVILN